MNSTNQRGPESTNREEFRHSLHILDGINSWLLWSSLLVILLLAATTVLLYFPMVLARISFSQTIDKTLAVRGLLGILGLVTAFTWHRQHRRLRLLRSGLIEQTDAATKHRVRGEQLYGMSIIDPLTGLYNRRYGQERLEKEIKRAEETGDPLLVLAVDFDRFKQINDTFGHAAGDLALKEFSRRLQRAIRACDVPIRIGGDEFLVILPDCPPEMIQVILSRMGSIVLKFEGNQIPVGFSQGMAQFQVSDTPESIVKRADERLYVAKANRKTPGELEQANNEESATDAKDPETDAKDSGTDSKESEVASEIASSSEGPGKTCSERVRRSKRIPKQMLVDLLGIDLQGQVFSERTHTVELSRHGARVVSKRKLAPNQEIIIRRRDTKNEAEVCIVRTIASEANSHTYGVALVNPNIDIWGIEFPPLSQSEKETVNSLFECNGCKSREAVVDKSDLQSVNATGKKEVTRFCESCGLVTAWTSVFGDPDSMGESQKPETLAPEESLIDVQ